VRDQKALWTELRRGSLVLLVPETAWLSLWWRASGGSDDEPVWDEAGGAWLVSLRTAERLAARVDATDSSLFTRTVAHFEGEFASGTAPAAALTQEGAELLRRDLANFLRCGPFSWRIVSV
jgi:hypothetical protein